MTKLSIKDKINTYNLWKNEHLSIKNIAKKYGISFGSLTYTIALIDRYGIECLNRTYHFYSSDFKEKVVLEMLDGKDSIYEIGLKYTLPSNGMLHNWLRSYRENGYTIVTKKKGRKVNGQASRNAAGRRNQTAQKRQKSLTREELQAAHTQRIHKKLVALVDERIEREKQDKRKK